MIVTDFHSHILPGIDDGSRDVETSIEMLRISQSQGVGRLIATPHFYAEKDNIESFLEKRQHSYEMLAEHLEGLPEVYPGAEAAFFFGISQAEKISELCIRDTNLLLLEMPFTAWPQSVLDEVERLACKRGFRVIIAHLERYLKISGNKQGIRQLLELPVVIQINAGSLMDWKTRGPLLKMFKNGTAQLLGSDCHSLHRRPPNLVEGRAVLKKKLGDGILQQIDAFGEELLR